MKNFKKFTGTLKDVDKDLSQPSLSAPTIYKLLDYWVSDLNIKPRVMLKLYLAFILKAKVSNPNTVTQTIEQLLGIKSRLSIILFNKNPTVPLDLPHIMREFEQYTSLLASVPKQARKLYTYNEWNNE
ncbi:hypothetical protein Q8V59_004203 [Vibrio vulnificus]|nr:hypothetical protein [Vibrio vulnificus]